MLRGTIMLFVVLLSLAVLTSPVLAGVQMEYDLSAEKALCYEYTFREFAGPDASQLTQADDWWADCQVEIRFDAEGRITIQLSQLRIADNMISIDDIKRFSDVTCTVTAEMDAAGRLENISDPEVVAVPREGETKATPEDVLALRGFVWPILCRSTELALPDLPPIERGPGQSWRIRKNEWGCHFTNSDRLLPFEFLQVSDVQDDRIVEILGGPEHQILPRDLPAPIGIPGVPLSRRQYHAELSFDLEVKAIRSARFTKLYETNSKREGFRNGGIYVAKQVHEITLLE